MFIMDQAICSNIHSVLHLQISFMYNKQGRSQGLGQDKKRLLFFFYFPHITMMVEAWKIGKAFGAPARPVETKRA